MRLDTLRNRAVVDPDSASEIGVVTDYCIDAMAGRVAALIIRPVDVDLSERVAADRVAHVGRDAVMLSRANSIRPSTETVSVVSEWLDRRHLRGITVYTDTGERLGRIDGAEVDPATLAVQTYRLAPPLWRRWLPGQKHVAAEAVAWCGRDVLVIRTDQLAKLRPVGREDGAYPPGSSESKTTRPARDAAISA